MTHREVLADRLEVAEQEAVRQAEGGAGLEGLEDLLVQLGLRTRGGQAAGSRMTSSAAELNRGGRPCQKDCGLCLIPQPCLLRL